MSKDTPTPSDVMATVQRAGPSMPPGDTFVRMEPGEVIAERLEIGNLLGQGGMGNVYAARDRLKEQDVAIKVLRQDLQFSTAAKERFLAEAKVSCNLSHPNIVRVHDVGVSGGHYFFSMERLQGHNLRQRIEAYRHGNRTFSVAEVTHIARQLVEALHYAHRYIVHRDIKPENIWMAEDGAVKLMDFGIARVFANSQLTQTGIALGTAYYMSPEQRIGSKDVDWRTDQYALGVVLYELLAGTVPTGAVKSLHEIRRDVPKRYAAAVMRAMAAMPEERFGSLQELLAEIEAPLERKRVGLVGLLVGVGVAAAAAGVFVMLNNQKQQPDSAAMIEADQRPAARTAPDPTPVEPLAEGESASIEANADQSPAPTPSETEATISTPPPQPVARAVTSTNSGAGLDARRKQCVSQCERDDGECRSITRRGKQECMRGIAFGSKAGRMTTDPAMANCAFFSQSRCEYALDREACLSRMTTRYRDCVETLGGSVASRRQDCDNQSRESDQMCLETLRECRASCQ
ncbi:MAG: protein kinase [Steroidobacter sp.]